MTAYELIVGTLEAVGRKRGRRDGDGWMYSCPGPSHANGDREPSLSVRRAWTRDGKGRARLKCYAGCEDSDVLKAINLRVADLFDRNPGHD